ncbi:beta family protein [Micromonospora cathayae]|uniref:Beta family protein n=1 Tax=Micromonospora cathayae TaxID=3028804 RepID=A0ABY7ZW48_9ACTN|nr:beta family protein [Micromonospora sp. HUAS 3]WDZ87103.1 beta family protein [Micromonospora sp. HUAS 3]
MVSVHRGRAAEPVYRPILTVGRGDLAALRHLDGAAAALIVPVLTVPASRATASTSAIPASSGSGPGDLFRELPAGLVPAVDLAALPDSGTTFRWWHQDVPLVPVIGLVDSDDRLAAQGAAARAQLGWVLVRFRLRSDRWGPDAATGAAERIWRRAGLVPEQCDLLIDVGDVCCPADVRATEPRVRRLAGWARRHAWRSVTVAAGAVPATLPGLPDDRPVPLVRWDWLLWRNLADLGLGYGDYGISPAVTGPGAGGSPADRYPADGTMRYTADGTWWVYRWSRRGGRGDDRVADLCRAVVSAPYWPTVGGAFSWGDHEILRRARGAAGSGSAAIWAAWGTSHHLAHVLAELRRPGGPPPPPGRPPSPPVWPPSTASDQRGRADRPGVRRSRRTGPGGRSARPFRDDGPD